MTRVTTTEREILEAIRDGSTVSRQSSRTYVLQPPGSPWYGGRRIRATTVRSLIDAAMLDTSFRLTNHGRATLAELNKT